jgi:hypothetical protein
MNNQKERKDFTAEVAEDRKGKEWDSFPSPRHSFRPVAPSSFSPSSSRHTVNFPLTIALVSSQWHMRRIKIAIHRQAPKHQLPIRIFTRSF